MDQLPVDVQDPVLHGKPLGTHRGRIIQVSVRELEDPRVPSPIHLIELFQRLVSGPRVGECLGVDFLAAEVPPNPIAKARDDDVRQPPGNRGHRGRGREVHRPFPRTCRHRSGRRAMRADAPAAAHRLPEVLLVSKTVQPRPQVLAPVPIQLLREPLASCHCRTLQTRRADSVCYLPKLLRHDHAPDLGCLNSAGSGRAPSLPVKLRQTAVQCVRVPARGALSGALVPVAVIEVLPGVGPFGVAGRR